MRLNSLGVRSRSEKNIAPLFLRRMKDYLNSWTTWLGRNLVQLLKCHHAHGQQHRTLTIELDPVLFVIKGNLPLPTVGRGDESAGFNVGSDIVRWKRLSVLQHPVHSLNGAMKQAARTDVKTRTGLAKSIVQRVCLAVERIDVDRREQCSIGQHSMISIRESVT